MTFDCDGQILQIFEEFFVIGNRKNDGNAFAAGPATLPRPSSGIPDKARAKFHIHVPSVNQNQQGFCDALDDDRTRAVCAGGNCEGARLAIRSRS